tara:strand:- start:223 stop:366 length:144 start_codon:yes stop_codon:yes gene_type:complete
MVIDIDEAIIKAKAQMEYVEDINEKMMELGFLEDTISGDLMRDEVSK